MIEVYRHTIDKGYNIYSYSISYMDEYSNHITAFSTRYELSSRKARYKATKLLAQLSEVTT